MQQKMSIFREGNIVCRVQKFYFKLNFDEFFMKDRGTMRQKMSIFKGGNSVCRVQKIQVEC